MQHAGLFIRAYLTKLCPQSQPRLFLRECPIHGTHWEVDVVRPCEVRTQLGKYIMQDCNFIGHFCDNLLTLAGYDLNELKKKEAEFYAYERTEEDRAESV